MRVRFWHLAILLISAPAYSETGGVVLVNGASSLGSNYADFYADLDRGRRVFQGWTQVLLAAGGNIPASEVNGHFSDADGNSIYDSMGFPVFKHYSEPGAQIADLPNLKSQIENLERTLPSGKPLVLYFTDHGSPGSTSLFGEDKLTAANLGEILATIPPSRKVMIIHDHCYSGSMLEAQWDKEGKIRPNTCGFSSAASNEVSNTGESIMRFASRSRSFASFGEVIHAMRALSSDDMGSTPQATSDIFLEKYLAAHPDSSTVQSRIDSPCILDSKSTTGFLDGISQPLLRSEIMRIKSEIKKAISRSKMNPQSSYQEVLNVLKEKREDIARAGEAYRAACKESAPVTTSFIQAQTGPKAWERYRALDKSIDGLREEAEKTDEAKIRLDLERQIKSLLPEYDKLSFKVKRARSADTDGKAFKSFVEATGNGALMNREREAQKNFYAQMDGQRSLLALAVPLRDSLALEAMIRNNDFEAIHEYLGIIECENTPIVRKGPSS